MLLLKRTYSNKSKTKKLLLRPDTIVIVAPRAAPEEIPITYGSAMGFLKYPETAPTTDKAIPTSPAKIILGSLIFQIIISWDFIIS